MFVRKVATMQYKSVKFTQTQRKLIALHEKLNRSQTHNIRQTNAIAMCALALARRDYSAYNFHVQIETMAN